MPGNVLRLEVVGGELHVPPRRPPGLSRHRLHPLQWLMVREDPNLERVVDQVVVRLSHALEAVISQRTCAQGLIMNFISYL